MWSLEPSRSLNVGGCLVRDASSGHHSSCAIHYSSGTSSLSLVADKRNVIHLTECTFSTVVHYISSTNSAGANTSLIHFRTTEQVKKNSPKSSRLFFRKYDILTWQPSRRSTDRSRSYHISSWKFIARYPALVMNFLYWENKTCHNLVSQDSSFISRKRNTTQFPISHSVKTKNNKELVTFTSHPFPTRIKVRKITC